VLTAAVELDDPPDDRKGDAEDVHDSDSVAAVRQAAASPSRPAPRE
jgi:hypothetical protein